MIVDSIKNIEIYQGSSIYKFLKIIKDTQWQNLDVCKVELDGKSYYSVDSISTKIADKGFWESHRKYVDIHYVIAGNEVIGYENIHALELDKPYNESKDLITYKGALRNPVHLKEGQFMVLFYEDAHMPNISISGVEESLRKVVFKIDLA